MVRIVGTHGKVLSQRTHVNYQSSSSYCSKDKVFKTMSRSRSQGKKCWYPWIGLATRNTHVKYQSSSFHCSNVIRKVKNSDRFTESQNDRQDKNKTHPILGHKNMKSVNPTLSSLIQEASGKHCSPELQFLYINKFKQNAGIPVLWFNFPNTNNFKNSF